MRIPHCVVALMGWLVILGCGATSAVAQQRTNNPYSLVNFPPQLKLFKQALDRGDYGEAFRILRPWADHNEIAAYEIGLLYAEGKGVPQDMAKARALMELANRNMWFPAHQWLQAHGMLPDPSAHWSVSECARAVESTSRDKYDVMGRVCSPLKGGSAQFLIELDDLLVNQYGDRRTAAVNYKAAADMGSAVARQRLTAVSSAPAGRQSAIAGGTICSDPSVLDSGTKQACLLAITLCSFGPAGVGASLRGDSPQSAVRACIAKMMGSESAAPPGPGRAPNGRKSAAAVQAETKLCQDEALSRTDAGIASCTRLINDRLSPQRSAVGFAYRAFADVRAYQAHDQPDYLRRGIADAGNALALVPGFADAYVARGLAETLLAILNSDTHLRDAAIRDLTRATTAHPDDGMLLLALHARARIYSDMHEFALALRDYDEEVKLSPSNAEMLYERSLLKKEMGRVADADADMRAARAINPSIGK